MLEIFLIGITVFHKNRDYPRLSNIKRQKYQEVLIKFYSTGRNDAYARFRHFHGEEMEAH